MVFPGVAILVATNPLVSAESNFESSATTPLSAVKLAEKGPRSAVGRPRFRPCNSGGPASRSRAVIGIATAGPTSRVSLPCSHQHGLGIRPPDRRAGRGLAHSITLVSGPCGFRCRQFPESITEFATSAVHARFASAKKYRASAVVAETTSVALQNYGNHWNRPHMPRSGLLPGRCCGHFFSAAGHRLNLQWPGPLSAGPVRV